MIRRSTKTHSVAIINTIIDITIWVSICASQIMRMIAYQQLTTHDAKSTSQSQTSSTRREAHASQLMSVNSSTQRSKKKTYRFIAREQRSNCVDVERRRESINEWSRDESTVANVSESRIKNSSNTRAWLSSSVDISSCVSKKSNKRDRRSSRNDERSEHIINVVSQTLSCVSCLFVCSFIVWLTSRDNREVNRRAHRERHEQDVRDRSHKSRSRRKERKRRERNRCEDSEVERLN